MLSGIIEARASPDSAAQHPGYLLKSQERGSHISTNSAVELRRAALSSAPHVHNEMAHLRRACDDVDRPLQLLVSRPRDQAIAP